MLGHTWGSEWGWMVGLGMPRASRLSSIWAGRCAEEKTTTQRARSPSGDQFMVLALSLPVKKQISWCVFKRPASEKHQEDIFSLCLSLTLSVFLSLSLSLSLPLSLFLCLSSFYSLFSWLLLSSFLSALTYSTFLGPVVRCKCKWALSSYSHMHSFT